MTTRAGLTGILTGLMATIIIYPFFTAWQDAYLYGQMADFTRFAWIAAAAVVILTIGGGWLAAHWSKSTHPGLCATLGGLAGGLAGSIVFCLWGAAAAGLTGALLLFDQVTNRISCQPAQGDIIGAMVSQTLGMFLVLFLGGSGLGALGGWLGGSRQRIQTDWFDNAAPKMALNVTITAVPACIVAVALAAAVFSRLVSIVGGQTSESMCVKNIVDMPLAVSLLLVLISHFALTLVIPHETQQAEHRCAIDEVKMAAYVGIGASPALTLLLLLIEPDCFSNPLVITALLASTGLSLKSLHSLFKLILPRRAAFPVPQEGRQKVEASLFGTIANSNGPHLVMLCIGCGLVVVLPLYVSVLSVLINLTDASAGSTFTPFPEGTWRLFLTQALVSTGVVTVSIVALTTLYLFYLNLGRWFNQWNSRRSN